MLKPHIRRDRNLKAQEMRTFSQEELKGQLNDAYKALLNLRFRLATKQLVNYHEIRNVKKRIARIKTVIRERAPISEE